MSKEYTNEEYTKMIEERFNFSRGSINVVRVLDVGEGVDVATKINALHTHYEIRGRDIEVEIFNIDDLIKCVGYEFLNKTKRELSISCCLD